MCFLTNKNKADIFPSLCESLSIHVVKLYNKDNNSINIILSLTLRHCNLFQSHLHSYDSIILSLLKNESVD